jgi:CRISPR-associated protein Cmr4
MKPHLFKIKCITNMHVGNGDVNYSIVNREVQKDPVLNDVATIHGSSLKGALKSYFESQSAPSTDIKEIFGNSEGEGKYKFLCAHLIARPLRVSDATNGASPYVLATAEDILKNFSALLSSLGIDGFYTHQPVSPGTNFFTNKGNITEVEGYSAQHTTTLGTIEKLIGADEPIAVTQSLPLLDFSLPVISRNRLDSNGISEEVWHEEVVPHESVFYFVVLTPGDTCDLSFGDDPVQIGANGSIGYGYTRISKEL